VAGCCEHGNEHFGSIKFREILECWLIKIIPFHGDFFIPVVLRPQRGPGPPHT
jgi:hypothetical protein